MLSHLLVQVTTLIGKTTIAREHIHHTSIYTQTYEDLNTNSHTHTHKHTHAQTHTLTHTHIHTHTHTHTHKVSLVHDRSTVIVSENR